MGTPDVTYIILDYNPYGSEEITPKFTQCVEALYRNSDPGVKKEVLVIEQGTHESALSANEALRKVHGFSHLILPANIGISRGINTGFQMGRGKVLALLTYDVLVTKGFDTTCLAAMERDATIWQQVPLSNVGDNPYQTYPVSLSFGTDDIAAALPGGTQEAGLVELTLNFFSREGIGKVGYFDEHWMACYENMDYIFRIMLAGGRTVINRGAYAWHYHNTSSRYVGRNHFYEGYMKGDPFADGRVNRLWLEKWGFRINEDTHFDSWRIPPTPVLEKYRASHGGHIHLGWPQDVGY